MFTIACCDDDPIWLQEFAGLLQPILQKHQVPYRLHTSACGGDLLEAVASRALSPDLLFLDVLLGEENGLDVAAALRRTLPDLSIVLVSCSPVTKSIRWITWSSPSARRSWRSPCFWR